MTLVQQIRITQKDQYEQNNGGGRAKQKGEHLVNPKNKPTSSRHQALPTSKTKKEIKKIVQQIIKQNPQTLRLLNNGKKGVK